MLPALLSVVKSQDSIRFKYYYYTLVSRGLGTLMEVQNNFNIFGYIGQNDVLRSRLSCLLVFITS